MSRRIAEAVIEAGSWYSDMINLDGDLIAPDGYGVAGIAFPHAGWSSETVHLQVSLDGETWYDLAGPSGDVIPWMARPGWYYPLTPSLFRGCAWVRLVCGGPYEHLRALATATLVLTLVPLEPPA